MHRLGGVTPPATDCIKIGVYLNRLQAPCCLHATSFAYTCASRSGLGRLCLPFRPWSTLYPSPINSLQEAEAAARRLFEDKVSKLHHLVSTAAQPGIFSSPYALATGSIPVVLGAPVEEHLKASMRMQVKSKPIANPKKLPPLKGASGITSAAAAGVARSGSNGCVGRAAAHGGSGHVYPDTVVHNGRVLPARLTLRQAAEYGAVHATGLLEEKVHRAEVRGVKWAALWSTLRQAG